MWNSLVILTLQKLGSLLVKGLVKPYKNVMLVPGATHSAFSGRVKASTLKLLMKGGGAVDC